MLSEGQAAARQNIVPLVPTDDGDPALRAEVMEALKTVRDPEIPVNLVDLGLIYSLAVSQHGVVHVDMTLTTPACPVAGSLPGQVQHMVSLVPGVSVVLVNLVWEPPWTRDRMSQEAMLELGLLKRDFVFSFAALINLAAASASAIKCLTVSRRARSERPDRIAA
jgi:FeS assembly SUF system protein